MTRCPSCGDQRQPDITGFGKGYCDLCENTAPLDDWEWDGKPNSWKCGECDFAFDLEAGRWRRCRRCRAPFVNGIPSCDCDYA